MAIATNQAETSAIAVITTSPNDGRPDPLFGLGIAILHGPIAHMGVPGFRGYGGRGIKLGITRERHLPISCLVCAAYLGLPVTGKRAK
jgi:hypothetical protein